MSDLKTMFPNMPLFSVYACSRTEEMNDLYKNGILSIEDVIRIDKKMLKNTLKRQGHVDFCIYGSMIVKLISKATTIGNQLSLAEAMKFIKSYSITQLKKNEYCTTMYDLENSHSNKSIIHYIWDGCYVDVVTLGSVLPRSKKHYISSVIPLIKNRRNILHKNSCREVLASKIFIYADNIVESLYTRYAKCTEEMIMRSFDEVIGHERQHAHIGRYYQAPYDYIKKHWCNIYNYSTFDIEEQCCNRAGFLHVINQMHHRKRELSN